MQLTVERHSEEEPVGNVHHDGPQQIESVHVSRGVRHVPQTVQVFGCGRHADPHRPLEAGARQSCNDSGAARITPASAWLGLFLTSHLQVVSLVVCFRGLYLFHVAEGDKSCGVDDIIIVRTKFRYKMKMFRTNIDHNKKNFMKV